MFATLFKSLSYTRQLQFVLFCLLIIVAGVREAGAQIPKYYGIQHIPNATDQDLDEIANLGVQWYRCVFLPEAYGWNTYDSLITRLTTRGLIPIFVNYTDPSNPPRTQADRNSYNARIATAAARYSNHMVFWEIWNEPDNPNYWGGSPNAAQYAILAAQAGSTVKSVTPNHVIMGPALGHDLNFLKQVMIAQPQLFQSIDIVSVHLYQSNNLAKPEQRIAQFEEAANIIAPYQIPGKDVPIVCSEWGVNTAGAEAASQQVQAIYNVRAWLTDLELGIPLSVCYQYAGDSQTQAYGIYNKLAYVAFATLELNLAGYTYAGRSSSNANVYLFKFYNSTNDTYKMVVWTTGQAFVKNIPIFGDIPVTNYLNSTTYIQSNSNGIQVTISAYPQYIAVPAGQLPPN